MASSIFLYSNTGKIGPNISFFIKSESFEGLSTIVGSTNLSLTLDFPP